MTLRQVSKGQKVCYLDSNIEYDLRLRLISLGFIPGVPIEVIQNNENGPTIILLKGNRLVLGENLSKQILVG